MLSWRKNHKKIAHLLPSYADFDAVSNQVRDMNKVLEEAGYSITTYSNHFPKRYKGKIKDPKYLDTSQYKLAIYHHSIGDPMADLVKDLNIPVILYYHNITPPDYFGVYNQRVYELLSRGKKQLADLAKKPVLALAASDFNKAELDELGYENTQTLPIFFKPKDLKNFSEDKKVQKFMQNDEVTNILFVGRFAPNKCHKDLIKAFYLYRKYYNSMSRLSLVGSYVEMNNYLGEIQELVDALELNSAVHIPGLVSDEEWKAYYKNADIFMALSEHEGFFVPALEANYFELPVLAYDAGAVKSTVADAGVVVKNKEPKYIAELIHKMVSDQKLREELVSNGKENYKRFDVEELGPKLVEIVGEYF